MTTNQDEEAAGDLTEQVDKNTNPRIRRATPWIVGIISVLVVLGVIAGLGGFETRASYCTDVAPGTWVSVNSAEIRILDAKAELSYDRWKLVIRLDIRNTSGQPLRTYNITSGMLLGYTNQSGERITDAYPLLSLRTSETSDQTCPREILLPIDSIYPASVSLYIYDGLDISDPLAVVLYPMVYANAMAFDMYGETWVPDIGKAETWRTYLGITVQS